MNKEQFVTELARLRPASTFLTLHKYQNEHSEVADFNIIFHMSYENAIRRSIEILTPIVPDSELASQAKFELLQSFHTSLQNIKETEIEDIDDAYTRFFDNDGKYIKGVKMHTDTGNLHLYGLVHAKRVVTPGVYPKKNKRPLTIEKDKLRELCPVGKFRQFRILPGQVEKIRVEKMTMLPPGT